MSVPDLRPHLVDDVLAWWDANGPDPVHGGVLTCWDQTGTTLVSTDKYTWSQGRWAWLTARVADAAGRGLLPLDAERWAGHARTTARFMRDHALLEEGGGSGRTAFLTDRAGRPKEPAPGQGIHASVFADLFAALGFAGAGSIEAEAGWSELADRVLTGAAARIRDGGAPTAPYPVPAGHHSLALPMMLLGVGTEVHRVSASAASAEVVADAARQIATHHVSGDDVAEMPPVDPAAATGDDLVTRHRTPGHVLELAWFLHHARDVVGAGLTGDVTRPDRVLALARRALALGWDEEHSGLLRYVDADGGQPRGGPQSGESAGGDYERLVRDTWDTKLWWPHAEAMYATRLLELVTGDAEIGQWRQRVDDYTLATFPLGPGREWGQVRDRNGRLLDTVVALPVLDPFHVARALLLRVELEAAHAPTRDEPHDTGPAATGHDDTRARPDHGDGESSTDRSTHAD